MRPVQYKHVGHGGVEVQKWKMIKGQVASQAGGMRWML